MNYNIYFCIIKLSYRRQKMTHSINKLKQLWQKDNNYYRKTEVGTGVQSFVKKILESDEIFKLKEGKLSTKLQDRKNEFIHEKKAKQQRKADFYIYISPDIAIPVEVECYGNIKAGEVQLLKYQKDFEKQYGILTDGYTWRFYNNNVYRTFTLDSIFNNTSLFLTFWKEYIKAEGYYLSFFEKIGQLALVEEKILHVENYRQSFFEDITKLIQSFKNKLQIEGYLEETEEKSKEQRAIELTYAYIIQFILYKTLVDNDFDEFPKEFEGLVDTIHQNLKKKSYKDILGVINGISDRISKNIYRPFNKEQEFINKRIFELFRNSKNSLNDVSPWLDIFVFIKKYNFANVKNEIFGFIYENYLKALYEEEQKGQYFTDPAVVNFMLEQIGYTPECVKKRYEFDKESISLIDPACGSGTFLYAAADIIIQAFKNGYTEEASKKIEEAVTKNIFGLDIEEFPLYLAEMSILMRLLPIIIHQKYNNPIEKKIKVFKTRDSISEFMDTALRNTFSDIDIEYQKNHGQMSLFTKKLNLGYSSYVRDEDDLKEMKKSLENGPKMLRRRFDYVIGNPPYVGYNECSKQKLLIFELMKQNKAKLSDIYGLNLHSTPERQKKSPPKPNLYAFFIALGLALLKDDGKLCFIVPRTILTAGDLDVIRYHLSKFTTIERIITFGGQMFTGRGLKQNKPVATSSLILVLSRNLPSQLHQVEILNYQGVTTSIEKVFTDIKNKKQTRTKKVQQNTLYQKMANWNFIKLDKNFLSLYEEYNRNSEDLAFYYDHALAKTQFKDSFYFDIGYEINERLLTKEPSDYKYPKLDKNYYLVHSFKGYWHNDRNKTSKFFIKLLKTNQGYNLLNSPHKILWSYINPDKFHFSSQPLIWARNQICAIGSKNKIELLYLLSLLNANINKTLLNLLLRTETEKDLLVSIASIKQFIRIPQITSDNQHIKNKVIKLAEKLLDLEKITLGDLVDFSGVMTQKFDSASVEDSHLVLKRGKDETKLSIKKDKELVKKIIEVDSEKLKLNFENKEIVLSELMSTPAIDFEKQKAIKNHIDDLVFALYFNVDIPKNKLDKPEEIKKLCQKNKFYNKLT
jgi:hypothetical protein